MVRGRIYPVGVQTFSDIIEEGMVYVDKNCPHLQYGKEIQICVS